MANSKIIFGGVVLIDLTADTVTQDKVLSGVTFHENFITDPSSLTNPEMSL